MILGDDLPSIGDTTYLLTSDLEGRMKALTQSALVLPSHAFFNAMRGELVAQLSLSVPDANVRCIEMDSLAEGILRRGNERCAVLKDAEIVSSCIEVASKRHGCTLEINRIVDADGSVIGLGPRPGHPALEMQIASISKRTAGRPLVLAEDGSFTGDTLCFIVRLFAEANVKIDSIIIGFAFPEAINNVRRQFTGDITVIEQIGAPLDWVPDHDFYPFVPNCGLTVGVKMYETVMPFYTMEGASYAIPYIQPFGPLTKWARIPQTAATRLSAFCLQQSARLFQEIERINETKILISSLLNVFPRVSIPMCIGDRCLPHLETRVVDYLNETAMELA